MERNHINVKYVKKISAVQATRKNISVYAVERNNINVKYVKKISVVHPTCKNICVYTVERSHINVQCVTKYSVIQVLGKVIFFRHSGQNVSCVDRSGSNVSCTMTLFVDQTGDKGNV